MRWAQKGADAAAIGRSPGGLTTKLHTAVDAIGLPIRTHPTPGQLGDAPQAENLLAPLQGVGHVIADAAYDADPLRAFIKRFRRIALRCEKTLPAFMGFVPLACAMIRIR